MSILVPIDTSTVSRMAVPEATRIAAATGDSVLFVTVPDQATIESVREFARVEGEDPADILEANLRSLASTVAEVETAIDLIVGEDVASAIVDRAARPDVSMIIMASHGRTGLSRWRIGSVAEKVLRAATVPVMVIPAPWRTRSDEPAEEMEGAVA